MVVVCVGWGVEWRGKGDDAYHELHARFGCPDGCEEMGLVGCEDSTFGVYNRAWIGLCYVEWFPTFVYLFPGCSWDLQDTQQHIVVPDIRDAGNVSDEEIRC